MNVKIEITLTEDEYPEETKGIQAQIEEYIPDSFYGMREIFRNWYVLFA